MYKAGSGTPYWYEWEIGLLECLKMMTDTSVESVVLQSEDFQSLDDVVINYTDGSIVNIQVKHSDNNENFVYSTLTSGKTPMLDKWAKEWQREKSNYEIKEIRIVTNRQWGPMETEQKCSFECFVSNVLPRLQLDYDYTPNNENEINAVNWLKNQISYLGKDASDFVKILKFYQEKNLEDVEAQIKVRISKILGTDKIEAIENSTRSLLSKLSVWATSQRQEQEITREEIYKALCISSTDLPNYELYPEKPIFPSRETFAKSFLNTIQNSDKKMFFLQGLPGAGKTNFVSYLAQLDNSIVDFRFYTYLPANKEHPTFSDDEGYYTGDWLWRSILTQMKKCFEQRGLLCELNFPLIYNYLSVSEMREKVLEYLPLYSKAIGRTCYLFIDGLDHAARSKDSRKSFLSQLPLPNELGDGVKTVLVGQPINDKYPRHLINNEQIQYIDLPVLEEADIAMLLSNERIDIPNVDGTSLAKSIISVVGNNALNVLFAIYEIKKMQTEYTFDSMIDCLREKQLNCQIDRYYEWIVSSIDENSLLLKIKTIFAFASQKIKLKHIADMCEEKIEDVVIVLNKLYPLVVCDLDEYYTFHNDVRLYFKESMIANSNYDVLAMVIYNKVLNDENLGQYKYDILFGIAFELQNKQVIFDLFSPEYIIKSIQYKISVNRLIQQFHTVAHLACELKTLDNIDKISFSAATISQYIRNIEYNQKENLYYDDRSGNNKTESEKYILSIHNKLNDIVYDIYFLLKSGFAQRAENIFDEYLKSTTLNDFINGSQDDSDREFSERCGFICRYFASDILEQEAEIESQNYLKFVKGWLEASSEFVSEKEIQNAFSFKYYNFKHLNDYTMKICSEADLDVNAFGMLIKNYLSEHDKPIVSLVELCVKGILLKYNVDELRNAIRARENEILSSDEFEYDSERILCYIKAYFCLFTQIEDNDEVPELYINILKKSRINPDDRGYVPAIKQFSLSKQVIKDFFDDNADCQNQIETIYSTVFFTQQHGTGSCFDCNAHKVTDFLLSVIYFTHQNAPVDKLLKICSGIKPLFVWENARYVKELTQLFYISNAKGVYFEIAEHWTGKNGILWDKSYDTVEYIGEDVCNVLTQFGLVSEAQDVEKRVLFKLFGYVDHKDYSLNGLLECYKQLPLTEGKLLDYGMRLLAVSDKARSIGDNRMARDIDAAVFDTAVELGVKYASALFELKNTPEEFYDWRNCFLDSYYKKISDGKLPDSELASLYNIVNAWINEDIENAVKRGYNQLEYLHHYNYKIIECVKNEELRQNLMSYGKYSSIPKDDIEKYVSSSSNNHEELICEIKEHGYCETIEERIISMFSDAYRGQVNMLIDVGKVIDIGANSDFISNCVVEYIVQKRKYGYHGMGLDQLVETYHNYFSNDDWMRLFDNIVSSEYSTNIEGFYSLNEDIEILCLWYYKAHMSDKMSALYENKLNVHWSWLTSCGLINLTKYELSIDNTMKSLRAFASYQLRDFSVKI